MNETLCFGGETALSVTKLMARGIEEIKRGEPQTSLIELEVFNTEIDAHYFTTPPRCEFQCRDCFGKVVLQFVGEFAESQRPVACSDRSNLKSILLEPGQQG